MIWHKSKMRNNWWTKLCDDTLYTQVNVAYFWKDVTCPRCLKLKGKR